MRSSRFMFLAAALFFTAAAPAYAETIAIVNVQKLMQEAKAAKSAREQLESKQKSYQKEISQKEEKLKKEDQELAKKRDALSQDAFDKKVAAFRSEVTEVQKEVQQKKSALDEAFAQALTDIQKAVTDIIGELAEEKEFTVAMPASQVLYYEEKFDITEEVLSRLDKKLPKVTLQFKP